MNTPLPIQPEPLVLASTSPRRIELLRKAGYRFEAVAPPLEEPPPPRRVVAPDHWSESVAYFKAASVAAEHAAAATILAADTIAIVNGEIIGKPADRDHAREILRRLSGTVHRVVTGLALLRPADGRRVLDRDSTSVHVRTLSDQEIDEYLDTHEWMGKAGAYGIQDQGDRFVVRIDGSFSNVVGLPLERLDALFRRWQAADR